MAEGILSNIVREMIKKLSSEAFKELGMVWGVKDDITKLINSASSIKAVLVDAENQQSESAAIKDWLGKLKNALYDVEDVIDELSLEALRRQRMNSGDKRANQVCIFFSRNNQVAFAFKIAHEIKNVREKIDGIAADRRNFHLTEHIEQKAPNIWTGGDGETHSFIPEEEVVGRNDDKEKIKNHLFDMNAQQGISFIVIAGMGGLGKTTLAKFLYNDKQVSEFFNLKIWVGVSELFDVKMVVKKVIESATNRRLDECDMEFLQSQFREVVQGKKYLLVLDNIWNESEEQWFELKNLLLGGAGGSKIVITKRDNKLVAEIADMTSMYNLEGLSEENSWTLFKKVALKGGEDQSNNPNLIKLGKEIVQKCKGIPLVIRSIGRVLYFKTSEEEWISFKDRLQLQQGNDVISNLKLSYDHLPSSYLKQCFAYCSLFPKDHSIKEHELIRQSIAHGFVQSSDPSKFIEDIGDDYFMELCWRSMLQSSSSKEYKMHDLMHDLAQRVADDEYKSINFLVGDRVNEKTRHISFQGDLCLKRDIPTSIFKAKGLRTFLLHHYGYPRNEFNATLNKVFSSFVRLRVFKLQSFYMKKVSKSINKLRHLRYLDLSKNYDLEFLPNSIIDLLHLQTLDLHDCRKLKKLPRDICNLVNLRHLDLHNTCLTHMPKGMKRLTSLQTLNMFVLGKKNHARTSKLSELERLNHLRGLLQIRGLERCTPSEASLASLKDKKGLRDLIIKWEGTTDGDKIDDEMVLEGLEPHPNAESLSIIEYRGGRLSNWISSLSKLTAIKINDCQRLHHLPQFDQLPVLKSLILSDLLALEFIDQNKDPFSSSIFFPSLQYLRLLNVPNLKGWWKWDSTMVDKHCLLPSFPPLLEFIILHCPKLASMPLHSDLKFVEILDISLETLVVPLTSSLRVRSPGVSSPSSSNIFSPFALEHLHLQNIEDLEFLPDQLWPRLEYLGITNCKKFKGCVSVSICEEMQDYLTSGSEGNLHNKVTDGMRGKLKILELSELPELVSLPIGPQHLTALQSLYIKDCVNFTHLPEWIGSLVALEKLSIFQCPNLKSLPEGICQLKSLRSLCVMGCPEVGERCKQGGEDWPKIAHVPDLDISD